MIPPPRVPSKPPSTLVRSMPSARTRAASRAQNGGNGLDHAKDPVEPLVDVLADEGLIVAEMPGIEAEDICMEIRDGLLIFSAERGHRRYRKELSISPDLQLSSFSVSCRNGIAEIRYAS
jgi:HSP20 family molecular chaperone IbpA